MDTAIRYQNRAFLKALWILCLALVLFPAAAGAGVLGITNISGTPADEGNTITFRIDGTIDSSTDSIDVTYTISGVDSTPEMV